MINYSNTLILWAPNELSEPTFSIWKNNNFRMENEIRIFEINNSGFEEIKFTLTPIFKLFPFKSNVLKINIKDRYLLIKQSWLNDTPVFNNFKINAKKDSDLGLPQELSTALTKIQNTDITSNLPYNTYSSKNLQSEDETKYQFAFHFNRLLATATESSTLKDLIEKTAKKRNTSDKNINTKVFIATPEFYRTPLEITDQEALIGNNIFKIINKIKDFFGTYFFIGKDVRALKIKIVRKSSIENNIQKNYKFSSSNAELYIKIPMQDSIINDFIESKKIKNKQFNQNTIFLDLFEEGLLSWFCFFDFGIYPEFIEVIKKDKKYYEYFKEDWKKYIQDINLYCSNTIPKKMLNKPLTTECTTAEKKVKEFAQKISKKMVLNRFFNPISDKPKDTFIPTSQLYFLKTN